MATGARPFHGATSAATFDAILHKAPTAPIRLNPSLPDELERIITKALEQSPFLRIVPEESVQAALRYMSRPSDQPVTKEIGREICERQGIKALLVPTIARLGNQYVITLEAYNGQTGEVIARQQAEADSKERVRRTLGEAASELRRKLGESLPSIQKSSAPLEQVTTSSLEAWKAFCLGEEERRKGRTLESIPFFLRATELDPQFALAYARLSLQYSNSFQVERSLEFGKKAYDLRDRVTERERLFIEQRAPGKWNEISEVLVQRYPGDWYAHNGLGISWRLRGEVEKALVEFREALRLNPDHVSPYVNLGWTYLSLNRFKEAQEILDQGLARHLETTQMHGHLYDLAFIRGNDAAMTQQLDWARGRPDEDEFVSRQARTAAFAGHLRQAQVFSSRAIELAQRGQKMTMAGQFARQSAIWNALSGDCGRARTNASRALALSRSSSLQGAAQALAVCGEYAEAEALAGELAKSSQSASAQAQEIRALIEIQRGKPDEALELLPSSSRTLSSAYSRGLAHLAVPAAAEAATDFQYILDRRGLAATDVLYPLAHLGLARVGAHGRDREEPHQLSGLH